jgi:hypothetical protein
MVLGVVACRGEGPALHPQPLPPLSNQAQAARVFRLERSADLLRGAQATGALGDFRIDNGEIALVIAGLASADAGAILDAGRRRAALDALRGVTPVVGRERMHRPRYDRVDVEQLGGASTLRLRGVDPAIPGVAIVTEYTLHPGSSSLRLLTTVVNSSAGKLLQYQVGDLLDWGEASVFAPGIGRRPTGRPALPWLTASAEHVAYGYHRRDGSLAVDFDGSITSSVIETVDLRHGERVTVQRLLTVGRGDADLVGQILTAQGTARGHLEVVVVNEEADPVAGATIELRSRGRPLVLGRTREDGTTMIDLPPGEVTLQATTGSRISGLVQIDVGAAQTLSARLQLGPPSRLIYDVRDVAGQDLPLRLTIEGIDPTPTPWLGPLASARPGNELLLPTGQGAVALPPGRYRVLAAHGPEHTTSRVEVTLQPHRGAHFTARLQRVVDSHDFVAIDVAQPALGHGGCAVSHADRLLADAVDDLAAAVLLGADPRACKSERGVRLVPGRSWRSVELGLVTLYPRSGEVADAAAALEAGDASAAIVQLDQGRRPAAGLLARAGYDPAAPDVTLVSSLFSALRILDGERPADFERLLQDWLSLLRAGRRVVATAGSGDRTLGEGIGPRTYVELGPTAKERPPLAEPLLQRLRQGRAMVSSGPFLRLTVDGRGAGETIDLVALGKREAATRPANKRPRPAVKKPAPREVPVKVEIWAPAWIGLDELTLYVGGQPWGKPVPIPGRVDGLRLQQTVHVRVNRDTFIIAVVRGSDSSGVLRAGLKPIALTNPVWIDFDGDGSISL